MTPPNNGAPAPTGPSARIGLGGGCHWCTEAVFAALRGVARVEQGFVRAPAPDDSWSEGVIAHFDPDQIPLAALIEIHLRTHASTSDHKMRGKYRSAVYAMSGDQARMARAALTDLQPRFEAPLVTRVLRFDGFRPSDARFQDYHRKNSGGPFCTRHIDPKLDLLRAEYGAWL